MSGDGIGIQTSFRYYGSDPDLAFSSIKMSLVRESAPCHPRRIDFSAGFKIHLLTFTVQQRREAVNNFWGRFVDSVQYTERQMNYLNYVSIHVPVSLATTIASATRSAFRPSSIVTFGNESPLITSKK